MITKIRIAKVPKVYPFLRVGQEFDVVAYERATRSGKSMWGVVHEGRRVNLLRGEFDIVETGNEDA